MLVLLFAALVPLALSREAATPQLARSSYIMGGKDASQGNWPWQASIQVRGVHTFGAALISPRWLVTAAHCVTGAPYDHIVVLGMYDKERKMAGPEEYHVIRTVRHPDYNVDGHGYPNDIALMYLSEEANIENPYIKPVTMASASNTFVDSTCHITGWGQTESGSPNRLQVAQVRAYSQEACRNVWGSAIGDYHVCAGDYGDQGACSGDSGGPLVCDQGGQWVLVGAASWVEATCSTWWPSVYSSIPHFRGWIRSVTGV